MLYWHIRIIISVRRLNGWARGYYLINFTEIRDVFCGHFPQVFNKDK